MNALVAENQPEKGKVLTPDEIEKLKEIVIFEQSQVDYTTLSPNPGQSACANCIFYRSTGFDGIDWPHCHIVAGWPKPIEPTGYCNRWEKMPEPNPLDAPPIPVVIVDVDVEVEEMALPTTRKGFLELVADAVKSILDPKEPAFQVFKAANGKHYWLARHTGKFEDREKEILANKAHDEYVERVQKGLVDMPELWAWHKKGTRHGVADMVWKSGGFVLSLGHFDDTPEAKKAIVFYKKNAGKIKLSHAFKYPKQAKQKGVYYAYNTFEITTLPDGAEAFPYTSFEELDMTLTEAERAYIRELGGDDMLKRVETADNKALTDTQKLESMGVQSKGHDDFSGSTIPADADVGALKTAQTDFEKRLKSVEELPAQVESLQNIIKSLTEKVDKSQQAEAVALERVNSLEQKLLEYQAVAPPASKSNDSIVSDAEKSLIEQMATAAKAETQKSLVEAMTGSQPAVSA